MLLRSIAFCGRTCGGMWHSWWRRTVRSAVAGVFVSSQIVLATGAPALAGELPSGGTVAAGTASISSGGNSLAINQSSSRAIINWSSFGIGTGNSVQFNNGSGATLNRVTGSGASSIDGLLSATGSIYLLNPNGVIVGKNGVVNVGGSFVASTLDVTDSNFLAGGDMTFAGSSTASVVNLGKVGALGGDVALIATTVENDGTISAPNGTAALAAGSDVLMRDAALNGGKFVVRVGGAGTSATNKGKIEAATAELRANGGNVYALAGNTDSVIRATGVSKVGGRVFLTAGKGGKVRVSGRVVARKPAAHIAKPGAKDGGTVIVSGDFIELDPTASIDAAGETGGSVAVAGRAVNQYGAIDVSGTLGAGGTVTVAADQDYLATSAAKIDASGATDGGLITVSAGHAFFTSGAMDASGLSGQGGTITLAADTMRFASSAIAADGGTQGGNIVIGGTADATLATQVFADAHATFSASGTGAAGQGGSISFWSSDNTAVGSHLITTGAAGGGQMEVSGHNAIQFGGLAEGANLTLDPKNIFVGDAASALFSTYTIQDPNNSGANGAFGSSIVAGDSYLLIGDYLDDAAASNAGAVYVFDAQTRALVGTITGSAAGDEISSRVVAALGDSGVAYVSSSLWNGNRGAVTLIDLSSGDFLGTSTPAAGAVSAANSIVGSTAGDEIGFYFVGMLGDTGTAYISSRSWSNTTTLATGAGAATIIDLSTGTFLGTATPAVGAISAANSIVGTTTNDAVGAGVYLLGDSGVAYVSSGNWSNAAASASKAGAVTFVDLSTGTFLGTTTPAIGAVDATNSIVGTTTNDQVGGFGVAVLGDTGTAYIRSVYWNNSAASASKAGAVTFVDLSTGTFLGTSTTAIGSVSAANSIVGSKTNDYIGNVVDVLGDSGVAYVSSDSWYNSAASASDAGAVTLVDLSTGTFLGTATAAIGVVSPANSIVGTTANDQVGWRGVGILDNGIAYIGSPYWNNTAASATQAGAVTLVDLSTGSFFGTTTMAIGGVSAANSIVGTSAQDQVGGVIGILGDSSVAYINSPYWDNTAASASDAGAVTLIDLSTDTFLGTSMAAIGAVSAANSIIGTTASDRVGSSGVGYLDDGVAYIGSSLWDNTAASASDAGAVTLVDLSTDTFLGTSMAAIGAVSAANSIVGATTNDQVSRAYGVLSTNIGILGDSGVAYVRSDYWNNTALSATQAGAVTLIDLSTGTFLGTTTAAIGAISATNSIVGTTANDQVGRVYGQYGGNSIGVLGDGGIAYIQSNYWNNAAASATQAGAVTLIDLSTGTFLGTTTAATGAVGATNSIVGTTSNDTIGWGIYGVGTLGDSGVAYVTSPSWNNTAASATGAGAVTLIDLSTHTFLATGDPAIGAVSVANSVVGTTDYDTVGSHGIHMIGDSGVAYIFSFYWNNSAASATQAGAVTLIDLSTGTFLATGDPAAGAVSAANSIVGATTGDGVGGGSGNAGVHLLGDSNVASIGSDYWDNAATSLTDAGAVTLVDLSTGTFLATGGPAAGAVSDANSIVGAISNEHFGSRFLPDASNTNFFFAGNSGNVVMVSAETHAGSDYAFSDLPASTVAVSASALATTLAAGTAVTLQANNDLTVDSAITVSAGGAGGDLILSAGRSVIANADISTDGGDLTNPGECRHHRRRGGRLSRRRRREHRPVGRGDRPRRRRPHRHAGRWCRPDLRDGGHGHLRFRDDERQPRAERGRRGQRDRRHRRRPVRTRLGRLDAERRFAARLRRHRLPPDRRFLPACCRRRWDQRHALPDHRRLRPAGHRLQRHLPRGELGARQRHRRLRHGGVERRRPRRLCRLRADRQQRLSLYRHVRRHEPRYLWPDHKSAKQ